MTRRQREFLQREALFLSTARTIMRSDGIANLSMERIADLTEYAKGTVYKHFTCKEDILCALCCESLQHLSNLLEHAGDFNGNLREKMLAMGTAYQLFTTQYPEKFDLIIANRTTNIRQKAPPKRVEQMDAIDQKVHDHLRSLLQQAIDEGQLKLRAGIQVDEVCFGLWAMSFGILVLDQAKVVIEELDLPPVNQVLLNQMNLLLDGYGWSPLSTEYDYHASFGQILHFMEPLF